MLAAIGNTFTNAFRKALVKIGASPKELAMPKPEKPRRDRPASRLVKLRIATGRGFRGPVFLPSREFHHVSRQTCRAALRGLAFAQISKTHPQFSRRTRRAVSRTLAKLEYLRMMRDDTNALPDNEHQAATRGAVAGQ